MACKFIKILRSTSGSNKNSIQNMPPLLKNIRLPLKQSDLLKILFE